MNSVVFENIIKQGGFRGPGKYGGPQHVYIQTGCLFVKGEHTDTGSTLTALFSSACYMRPRIEQKYNFRCDACIRMAAQQEWNKVVDQGMKTVTVTVPFYSLKGHSRNNPSTLHLDTSALLQTAGVAHPNALQFKSVDLTGSSIGTSVGFRYATHTLLTFHVCPPPPRPYAPNVPTHFDSLILGFSLKHGPESMSSVGTSAYVDVHAKPGEQSMAIFHTVATPGLLPTPSTVHFIPTEAERNLNPKVTAKLMTPTWSNMTPEQITTGVQISECNSEKRALIPMGPKAVGDNESGVKVLLLKNTGSSSFFGTLCVNVVESLLCSIQMNGTRGAGACRRSLFGKESQEEHDDVGW